MKKVNEMGMAQNRMKRRTEKNFELFRDFFFNLYMMPGIYVYLKAFQNYEEKTEYDTMGNHLNHKIAVYRYSVPIKINGVKWKDDYENAVSTQLRNEMHSIQSDGPIVINGHRTKYRVTLSKHVQVMKTDYNGFLCYLFSDLDWKYAVDVKNLDNVWLGIMDLEDFEETALLKCGFKKDIYYGRTADEDVQTVSISIADLYENIEEIYDLFYGEDENADQ